MQSFFAQLNRLCVEDSSVFVKGGVFVASLESPDSPSGVCTMDPCRSERDISASCKKLGATLSFHWVNDHLAATAMP